MEETLSDKIGNITCNEDFLDSNWNTGDEIVWAKDVKEFIRQLKEEFITDHVNSKFYLNLIDKLAGDKLI